MTVEDYRKQYDNGLYNDLNSLFRLDPKKLREEKLKAKELKNQHRVDLQNKNKALIQAQKAYQEAAPEQKQAALTNLQNAQQAQKDAETEYTNRLSKTGKDLYKVGQAGKAAGKTFISGVKQQFLGNKNNQQQGQQVDNTTTQQTQNNKQQTAEQKGSNIGQKAAEANGSTIGTIGTAIGTAIGNKWNMQQAGKDPTGTSEANRQIAKNHLNMQQATSQVFADRAKQNASRPLGSITGETTRHLTKENFDSNSKQAAADGGAKLMQQDNTVMGDINADRDFKTQQAQQAYDWQQEANDEQNVADILRQDASVMDYNAMQRADYNNQSNDLSNATNGQQEVVQAEQQPAQNPSNVQNADEESTGAKDQSFSLSRDQVQHVFNAFLGSSRGADIIAGKGTPEEQAYFEYIKATTGAVPSTTYDVTGSNWTKNENNKKAYNMLRDARAAAGTEGGGKSSDNFYRDKNGNLVNERTGQKASGYQNLQFTKETGGAVQR